MTYKYSKLARTIAADRLRRANGIPSIHARDMTVRAVPKGTPIRGTNLKPAGKVVHLKPRPVYTPTPGSRLASR